jgi:predicted O-methyltransferase YrrM
MNIEQWLVDNYRVDLSPKEKMTVSNLRLEKKNTIPPPIEIGLVGRNDLAKWFGVWGFKEVAEIGVEQGKYSRVICKANPHGKLYAVDAWTTYKGYRDYLNRDFISEIEKVARQSLAKYKVQFVKGFSMDVVGQFADESLDAVYIDANHEFKWILEDVTEWSKKVKKGGIISGHDYYRSTVSLKRVRCEVPDALHEYLETHPDIQNWYLLGLRDKEQDPKRDICRSWMWVKP